jgi:O-antigen/teichoic acid export membrane protein
MSEGAARPVALTAPEMSTTTRNVVANYAGQAWSAAIGLAFLPLYIRYLGVEAYGLIGLFTVLQACLSLLDMGMTPALSREMARFTAGAHTRQEIWNLLRSLETICFGVAVLVAIGIWAASDYLASDWLRTERLSSDIVADTLGIMAFVVGVRFCEGIYRGSLLGLQRQVQYNTANAALSTLRHTGAAGVLAWLSPTIEAFFLWQAGVSLITILVFARGVYGALPQPAARPRFSYRALSGIWRFASGVMAISLLSLLLTQVDKVLLSRLLTLEAFGYYSLAATVVGALYMVVGPITQAVYPRMVELSSRVEEPRLISVYHQAAQFISVVTAPAVALLYFFAGGVIFAWSGDATLAENTAPILSALIVGTFLNGLMWMPYHCQLAHGWTGLALRVNTVAVAALVPAIFWVVPRYGAVGAAWIWVALNAGYVLIAIQLMHRRLLRQEKWRWYFADSSLPVAGAIAVTLVARAFEPADYQSRLAWLAFLFVFGGLALVAATLFADQVRARLIALVRGSISWRFS